MNDDDGMCRLYGVNKCLSDVMRVVVAVGGSGGDVTTCVSTRAARLNEIVDAIARLQLI